MTIHSMTGFATVTEERDFGAVTIEIKSVNSRFLDLGFKINDDLRALEPMLRDAIMQRIARGKVECRVNFGKRHGGETQHINMAALTTLQTLQKKVLESQPDAQPLSVDQLLRWPGVIQDACLQQDALPDMAKSLATEVMNQFVASRAREGELLKQILLGKITTMQAIVVKLQPVIPQLVAQFQQKAHDRMTEALGLSGADDQDGRHMTQQEAIDRIRQEVTLYGIRIDVAEELARLSAHLEETQRVLHKGGQVGKRLDFMMQELNREANTLGSKAAARELADAAIELKLLIDQMREQVQNLE